MNRREVLDYIVDLLEKSGDTIQWRERKSVTFDCEGSRFKLSIEAIDYDEDEDE